MTVGIRANGGASIGLGHIKRCLALAEAIVELGARVVFVTNRESHPADWAPVTGLALEVVEAAEAATLHETRTILSRHGAGALVVDSYDLDPGVLPGLDVPVGVLVDAPPKTPLDVRLLVDGAADAERYDHPVAPGGRALLGPRFIVMSRAFRGCLPREPSSAVNSLLVTVGGSDHTALSLRMLDAARSAVPDAAVTVVVGPYFPGELVEALAARADGSRVTLLNAPSTLRDVMARSDLALTAGGQTTYELAATGTPACAVRVAANQTGNLEGLAASGTLMWVGDAAAADLDVRLTESVSLLAGSRERRQAMSRSGQATVDGRGAARVAEAVLALCA